VNFKKEGILQMKHSEVNKAMRRKLRKTLGSRTARRVGTKSTKMKHAGKQAPRPRTQLAAAIDKAVANGTL
jgi:hypothetical protein